MDQLARYFWDPTSPKNIEAGVTPEICLETIPFLSNPCFSALLAKVLGLGIIVGACLIKTPVILNIIMNKSAAGLSLQACYGEVFLYSNGFFYGYILGIPFSAYGEGGVLTLQSLIICLLCWIYRETETLENQAKKTDGDSPNSSTITKGVGLIHRVTAVLVYTAYLVFVLQVLPLSQAYLLQTVNILVLAYSKGIQIIYTQRVKTMGAQSLITTFMNLLGTFIRIMTTIQEVGWDIPFLSGLFLGVLLNGTTMFQFYLFSDSKQHLKKKMN